VTLFIVALRVGVAYRAKSCPGALKMLDVFLAAKFLHFVPSYAFAVQHCWMYLHATKCTGNKLVEEMLCEVFETQTITACTVSQRDTYIGLLLFTDMRGF